MGLDKLAPTVYEDVLQPAAKETGKQLLTVAKTISVVLSPLDVTVWGFDKIKKDLMPRLLAKLSKKPKEEIKSPDPIVAGPVVMGMAFASEAPQLREMYANLLATAMHAPSASKAHPSFAQAIQQLSPGEALILKAISEIGPEFTIEVDTRLSTSYTHQELDDLQHGTISHRWREHCVRWGVSDAVLADTYRDNLARLGIIAESYSVVADPFGGGSGLKSAKGLGLSEYGKLFIEICVRGI
jgi:hypothetical protein